MNLEGTKNERESTQKEGRLRYGTQEMQYQRNRKEII